MADDPSAAKTDLDLTVLGPGRSQIAAGSTIVTLSDGSKSGAAAFWAVQKFVRTLSINRFKVRRNPKILTDDSVSKGVSQQQARWQLSAGSLSRSGKGTESPFAAELQSWI